VIKTLAIRDQLHLQPLTPPGMLGSAVESSNSNHDLLFLVTSHHPEVTQGAAIDQLISIQRNCHFDECKSCMPGKERKVKYVFHSIMYSEEEWLDHIFNFFEQLLYCFLQ
jgi:hypothetical protein